MSVSWDVKMVTSGWMVSVYTVVEIWVRRLDNLVVTHEHQETQAFFTGLPPKTFVSVEVISLSFNATSLSKAWRVNYLDNQDNPQSFVVSVNVPPFNGRTSTTTGWHSEEFFTVVEAIVLPPPSPPPPVPVEPKPPPPISEPLEPEPEPPPPCGDLDVQTFREFWQNWGHRVERLAFEVPLDDGVDVPDLEEPWRSVWRKLTHHRIDVVFERKGVLYVAEIKPRLSIAAIGTAIVATTMVKQRYDCSRFVDVRPAVISQVGSPTLIQAAATHRVVIFLTKGVDGLYEPVALHDVVW